MEVTFENRREDIQALLAVARLGVKQGMLRIVGTSLTAFAPTILFLMVLGHWLILASVVDLWAIMMLLVLWSAWSQVRRHLDDVPVPEGDQTLRLKEDYLEAVGDRGRSRRLWRGFTEAKSAEEFQLLFKSLGTHPWNRQVGESERYQLLFLSLRTVYVIPSRAFDSADQEQVFHQRLKGHLKRAEERPEVDLLAQSREDRFLPDPQQSTWRLQFPGPVDLWQRVAQMGNDMKNKVNLPTVNALLAEGLMPGVMVIGVVALWMSADHHQRDLSPLYYALLLITCLVMTVFMARVVLWFRLRKERPQFEQEFGGTSVVELGPEGVTVGSRNSVGHHVWQRIDQPALVEDAIVLRAVEGQTLAIIPQTAFDSVPSFQACLSDIVAWQSTGTGDFRDEEISRLPKVPETGNPFQSPRTE